MDVSNPNIELSVECAQDTKIFVDRSKRTCRKGRERSFNYLMVDCVKRRLGEEDDAHVRLARSDTLG